MIDLDICDKCQKQIMSKEIGIKRTKSSFGYPICKTWANHNWRFKEFTREQYAKFATVEECPYKLEHLLKFQKQDEEVDMEEKLDELFYDELIEGLEHDKQKCNIE